VLREKGRFKVESGRVSGESGESTKEDDVYNKVKVSDGEKWQKLNVEQDPNTRNSRVTPSAEVERYQNAISGTSADPLI